MAAGFNGDGLIFSEDYGKTMREQAEPMLAGRCVRSTVKGEGGKPLAVYRFDAENPKGTVTVLHGFTECARKFSELILSLLTRGYSVLAYDQRGHGESWRDGRITDISLTHVDRFEEYVEDLRCVCEQALREMPRPWYVLAHSMGGAVTLAFLEDHPGVFEKAVLCSPMIAPNRGGLPLGLAKAVCIAAKMLGRGRKRMMTSKPWDGPERFEESCATGRERFDWFDDLRVRTEKFHNNGPTFAWTLEALRVTDRLLADGAPERVTIPVMIWTAEDDNQVLPEAQEQAAARLPKGKREAVAGARHEIYRSNDEVLFPWWKEVLNFFAS